MFSWLIIAYGKLVYKLLGVRAENDFISSWGIGVGVGQAQDVRALMISALEAVVAMTLLELLWLQSNGAWIEEYVDFASIYAAAQAQPAVGGKRPFMQRFHVYRVCKRYAGFANGLT